MCNIKSIIDSLPVKGSVVLGYFCEDDGNEYIPESDYYYMGVVVSSGTKEVSIKFGSDTTEDFSCISGKTDYYKHYTILGYVSYKDFYDYGDDYIKKQISKHISLLNQPDEKCIEAYKKQSRILNEIKRENKRIPKNEFRDMKPGKKLSIVSTWMLDNPIISSGFSRRINNEQGIFINLDSNLETTTIEDEYLKVTRSKIWYT